jgi:soluble lytic murein transglycosylase
MFGLSKVLYLRRDYSQTIDTLNQLLGKFPKTEAAKNAYFLLGESYFDISEFLQAAKAYARFAEQQPGVLDNLVYTYQGNAAFQGGDFQQAITAYQKALLADPPGKADYLNLQIGKSYQNTGDLTTAVQYFSAVYDATQDPDTKSTANLLAGRTLQELGLIDDANNRFMDSVIQFPKAFDSFTALSILVSNGVSVDDYYRGLVDYYAGSYD